MQKILERIRFLEAQERAAKEERERRNQLLRQDLKIQVHPLCVSCLMSHVLCLMSCVIVSSVSCLVSSVLCLGGGGSGRTRLWLALVV